MPFKIQIKSNKTNVNVLSLDLYTDESTRDSDLNYRFRRSFISILKNRTPAILDTTITVNVYSRTQFLMGNYIKLSDGKQIFGNHIIDSTDVRKVLFVNEIN